MQDPFQQIAALTGANTSQIKMIVALLVNCPLGSVFIRIPPQYPALRHAFSLVISFGVLLGLYGLWFSTAQLLASIIITYVIAKNVKGPNMPWIVFALNMANLSASHISRMINEISVDEFEISGVQMVLTMKLTTFAWNVWDGRRPREELDSWQRTNAITEFPSLLAFLGYAFYFPGMLVGPSCEYAAYAAAVKGAPLIPDAVKKIHGNRRMPKGRKRAAYLKMLIGLGFLGAFVFMNSLFGIRLTTEPWFKKQPLWYRIYFLQMSVLTTREKYYAVWKMAEGACILTGLGFTGFNKQGLSVWEGASNADILGLEFAPNFKVLLDSWNIKTNIWLRECVYKRVTPQGKKPGFRSSMITFTTSAFWHGFASGYYVTFIFAGFVQTLGRLCRASFRPFFVPPVPASKDGKPVDRRSIPPPPQTFAKRVYDVVGIAVTILLLNYITVPFQLLDVPQSVYVWSLVGYYGHAIVVLGLLFFYGGGTRTLKRIHTKRAKRLEEQRDSSSGDETGNELKPSTSSTALQIPPIDLAAREAEKHIPRAMR
ncbi:endoplasmic reticulum protein [Auricularia subglabra TFB-10046 SS5]|nr:endoplasmic reticulum protein [Auricularia subglabra TFB-10046 SS5]